MKLFLVLNLFLLSSCSVIIAGLKETKPISKNEAQEQLTEENFEKNISTKPIDIIPIDDNSYYKVYSLKYDSFARTRMFIHAGFDVLTTGLWELAATPGESNLNMTIYYVKVKYIDKKIDSVEILDNYTLKKEAI
tara:strand:+ start:690 stop:1094 length:405 start_codon:yes stop_codon:yes gene_type:complete